MPRLAAPNVATDPRFATNPARVQHRAELRAEIERTLAPFKVEEICGALMKNGVPAGAVNTVPQAFAQPARAIARC